MNIIQKTKKIFDPQNLVLFLFTIIALSMAWNTAEAIQKNYGLQQDIARLEQEIEILELENANLAFNIQYYQTDTYLELAARDKFNKAKPGENVLFLPKNLEVEFEQPATVAPSDQKSNLQSWFDFLLGKQTG